MYIILKWNIFFLTFILGPKTIVVFLSMYDTLYINQVRKKLCEMLGEGEVLSLEHEDHSVFLHQHDEQLLLWFNRWICCFVGKVIQ